MNMMERTFKYLDERLGTASLARATLRKVFPDHWSFLLGEIALFCLVVLIFTGTFLTFFYTPSVREVVYEGSYAPLRGTEVSAAYNSVLRLSFEVKAGLLMRQVHHWAALVFVAAIVIHLCRIFFTGAYRRPRELNWLVGILLLFLVGVHIAILVLQKHTQFPGHGRTERNVVGKRLWPEQTFKSVSLLLFVTAVLALLGGLGQINPVWQYGPF
ncbi:MAG TPA: cytochrome b N-terminal domain-containing protein, partial [Actinomycetes bacterium]